MKRVKYSLKYVVQKAGGNQVLLSGLNSSKSVQRMWGKESSGSLKTHTAAENVQMVRNLIFQIRPNRQSGLFCGNT
jgi:hypothetical protein